MGRFLQADAIFQQIGYPEFIMNQTLLEIYFSGVSERMSLISLHFLSLQ